ncbi:MAG TPA: hypothetical protein VLT86_03360 [Vicinamibacterales bacterium]|nr:hypothetical protein [Vicinamibacterales bacterium]
MSAIPRLTLVLIVALVSIAVILAAAFLGVLTWSTAVWFSAGVIVLALVAAKFQRHAQLPDSVRLH